MITASKRREKVNSITILLSLYFMSTVFISLFLPNSINKYWELIFVALILYSMIMQDKKAFRITFPVILLFYFALWQLINVVYWNEPMSTLLEQYAFFGVFVLASTCQDFVDEVIVCKFIVMAVLGYCIVFIGTNYGNLMSLVSRTTIYIFDKVVTANAISYTVCIGVMSLMELMRAKKIKTMLGYIVLAVFTICFFISRSRSGFAYLVFILATYIFFAINKSTSSSRVIKLTRIAIAVGILFAIVIMIIPPQYYQRVFVISQYSLSGREQLQVLALKKAVDHLFMGHGLTYWQTLNTGVYGSHNLFVDTLLESGIPGLLLIVLFAGWFVIQAIRQKSFLLVCCVSFMILNAMVESGNATSYWICAILASTQVMKLQRLQKQKNNLTTASNMEQSTHEI